MRNERTMTLAAFVVMLCCMGSVIETSSVNRRSNTIISRVLLEAYTTISEERTSASLEAPEQASTCVLRIDVPEQIEIEEFQNLPPPTLCKI